MAVGYNQTSDDLYDEYQTNVGISYTGLVYNLDVGYETTSIYNATKKRFIDLSLNYLNKNFTISTPGTGLLTSNGIGTVSIAFTGSGTDYETNDITATIPGIGTDTPSKITVEMWARINDFSGHYDGSVGNSGGMMFSFGTYDVWTGDNDINGTLGFNAFDATTVGLSTTTVQSLQLEGNWKHYAFVMNPYVSNTAITTENKIYIDSSDQGTLVNTRGSSYGNPNNRNFANGQLKINGNSIGSYSNDYKLDMDVGTVRVYDRALTAAEVSQNYNALRERYYNFVTTGLVLNLDAGKINSYPRSGTTWTDLSGQGNNGTLTNGPTFSSDNGGSIVFDGTDDYVQVTGSITVTSATFITWIKRDGTQTSWSGLIHSRNGNVIGLHFNQGGTKIAYTWNDASNTYQWNSNLLIPNDQWCMVALSVNPTSATAYLCQSSGITSNTNTVSHPSQTLADIIVGKDDKINANRDYDGNMAVAQIYNRALTASEITQNYNATKGRFGL